MKSFILINLIFFVIACGKENKEQQDFSDYHRIEDDLLYKWEKIRYSIDTKKFNELFSFTVKESNNFIVNNKDETLNFSFPGSLQKDENIPYLYKMGCLDKNSFIDLKLKKLDREFDHVTLQLNLDIDKNFLIPSSSFNQLKVNIYLTNGKSSPQQMIESKLLSDLDGIEISKTFPQQQDFHFTESTCLHIEIESFTLQTPEREIFYHKNMKLNKTQLSEERKESRFHIESNFIQESKSFPLDNFLPNEFFTIKGELKGTPILPEKNFIQPVQCLHVDFGPQPKRNCTCLATNDFKINDYKIVGEMIELKDDKNNRYSPHYFHQHYQEFKVEQNQNFYPTFTFHSAQKVSGIQTTTYRPRVANAICPDTKVQKVLLPLEVSFTGEMLLFKTHQ